MIDRSPADFALQRIAHFVEAVFRAASSETQDTLKAAVKTRYMHAGEVFAQGDRCQSIAIVGRGYVKVVQQITDMEPTLLTFRAKYSIVGEEALACARYRASVIARSAELFLIPIETMRARLEVDNGLRELLFRVLIDRQRDAAESLVLRSRLDVSGRVADWLLRHAEDVPPVNHVELAQLVGSSRQTVTEEICKLECDGVIKRKGRSIVVVDRARLLLQARRIR